MDGFRRFVLRGNVVDLAVGVVIGAAFGAVVTSIVTGIITPLVGLAGSQNFDKMGLCLRGSCPVDPKTGIPTGHVLLYGSVISAILSFLILAVVIYFGVVKPVNALMERFKTEPEVAQTTKECPECLSSIPVAALRCAFCTVEQLDVA
ncbi:MAG: large conductance mechanosensitive channel protein [Frankiales bacterium]|nr:large conductance mechanosensitive channel protein [Frankiales bacterium]